MPQFDLVVAADPRLAGAAERSLVASLRALAGSGYSLALIPTFSAERDSRRRFPLALRAPLAAGQVRLVDPDLRCTCRLLLGYHLLPFIGVLSAPLRVEAERRIVRCDQPLLDVEGRRLLHLQTLLKGLDEALGGRVALAPVDAGIAASLSATLPPERIAPPLPPVVAEARYRCSQLAPPKQILLVGDGWQQDQAAIAQARDEMASLSIETVLPSGEGEQADAVWVRPPWRLSGVLHPDLAEALASGLPVLGPASYGRALDACLIACVPDPVQAVQGTPPGSWEKAAAATSPFRVSLQPDALVQSIRDLIGEPMQAPPRLLLRRDLRPQRAAVFMSSNGVGIGHLIRGMAVARRLNPEVGPVFFTLSGAAHVAAKQGWPVESYQHVQHYGGDASSWREALAGRLDDLVGFHRPRVLVFDGNVPYAALFDLRAAHPEVWFVWVRRGMWRTTHDAVARRPHPFDIVLTPGELAADYDAGATAQIEDALPMPPITFFDREELSSRAAARLELGIADGTTAVLLQLGAGNNFNMATVRSNLIDNLARRRGVKMFEARWPMSFLDQSDPRVVRLERFPLAHLLRGFDLVISACGYNSFHEILMARVPAVFVPNENLEMDAQERRALWAERQGFAASGSALQPFSTVRAVEWLLEGGERAALHARLSQLEFMNGAAQVADLIAELSSGRRSLESSGDLSRRAAP
jgi:hypothetical protein